MSIRVSHVGSFPFKPDVSTIDYVIRGYLEAGVDAPPYPQFRGFIDMFLEPLVKQGVLESKGGLYVLKNVGGLKDISFQYAEPWEAVVFIEKARGLFQYFRAPITGAFTLASNILLKPNEGFSATGLADRKVFDSLVDYVKNTLKHMRKLGFNVLFIDEPVLSVIVGVKKILLGYTVEDIGGYIDYIFSNLDVEKGIHVCGRVSKLLFNTLIKAENLNILNFEFHGTRENVDLLRAEEFEAYSKKLSPGVASSRSIEVESVDEIVDLLMEITRRVGFKFDLVSADDGFGGLRSQAPEEELMKICFMKLKRIKEAVNILNHIVGK